MTNQVQLDLLKQGVEAWNKWRSENPRIEIDLSGADLYQADLSKINLSRANLERAFFEKADLVEADLMGANLSRANLIDAHLFSANLAGANLNRANLFGANLMGANLAETDLHGSTLANAILSNARIDKARVSGSWVYGVNVWDLRGEFAEQKDLIINHRGQPTITVDNIKVAQFIYLFLNNDEIRQAINTLTSKTVLILGKFASPQRKAVLNALKNELREYELLPIVFELQHPTARDFNDTIKTLASLSYFVIADLTNPKAFPPEMQAAIPDYQTPFVPILQTGERTAANMTELQKKYNWVLDTVPYLSAAMLVDELKTAVIDPAIKKRNKLKFNEAIEQRIRTAHDFIEKEKI